jgi:hypothetical protein
MADRNLASRRGPEPLPAVHQMCESDPPRRWSDESVIGSALRVAAPRSILGIVDQVQFAW